MVMSEWDFELGWFGYTQNNYNFNNEMEKNLRFWERCQAGGSLGDAFSYFLTIFYS